MNGMLIHKGSANLGDWWFDYTVIKEKTNNLALIFT